MDPNCPMNHGMSPLHLALLAVFCIIGISYTLRSTALKNANRKANGYFDLVNELAHAACAAFMVPMVVASFMMNPAIRHWSAALCAAAGAFFILRFAAVHMLRVMQLEKNIWWWDPVHAGMFLGMALMYWTHDHTFINRNTTNIVTWFSGGFYLAFACFYLKELCGDAWEPDRKKRIFSVQSDIAHIAIFGIMFLMILFPGTFMA